MSDFNTRTPDDQLYQDIPEITDHLDLFLHELDILFDTEQHTVFGQRKFGQSLEKLLWATSFSHSYIQGQITQSIKDSCSTESEWRWSVDVQLMKGVSKDIGVLTIHIKNSENTIVASPQFVFK